MAINDLRIKLNGRSDKKLKKIKLNNIITELPPLSTSRNEGIILEISKQFDLNKQINKSYIENKNKINSISQMLNLLQHRIKKNLKRYLILANMESWQN